MGTMGLSALRHDKALQIAIVASLMLHLFLAYVMPTFAWIAQAGPPIEVISLTRVMRITVQTPKPLIHQPLAQAPHVAAVPHVAKPAPQHAAPSQQLRTVKNPTSTHTEAPNLGATTTTGASIGTPASAAPQPAATAQIQQSAVASRRVSGGELPLGAEQPDPVLDPNVRKALAALNIHVTLVVTVGDDGRTKSIVFQPPLDAATESHIQTLLADASWDPAVCGGGIPCEGRAVIKL